MSKMKKVGYGLLSAVPTLLQLLIQMLALLGVWYIVMFYFTSQPGGADLDFAYIEAENFLSENDLNILVFTLIISLLIFSLWYYFAFKRNKEKTDAVQVFCLRNLTGIVLLGIGSMLLVLYFIGFIELIMPNAMEKYDELIEISSVGKLSLISFFVTVVLGPIVEEIIFRGLTFHYLKKAGAGFILANIIQSVLFGIYHLNLMQGLYVFLLGLILGYITFRFKTLVAPILLHCVFNLAGGYLTNLFEPLSQNFNGIIFVGSIVCCIAAFRLFDFSRMKPGIVEDSKQTPV